MPPSVEDRLLDILEAIAEIESTLAGKTREQFLSERPIRLITERLLEIVCEASRKLPDDIKQLDPGIPWREIIDFGNLLRHAYHSTKADTVWDIVQNDLPALKAFAESRNKASRD
ncbi:DUF86 domain-containing protein [uncultured Bradyrhizobium sp.]|uniref:HepT-like ribonuclease domain-containing protein n=1 Tax=uncultured Bradyrhizobium sp. TaxID=199684 RepID=UPI0035CBF3F2